MLRTTMGRSQVALACGTALILLSLHSDESASRVRSRMEALPSRTLWTWERREDLSSIDPTTTAVASLDRTVLLTGSSIRTSLQRNGLRLSSDPRLRQIAVVRIETHAPELTEVTAGAVSEAVLQSLADIRNSSALQIDFDARRSERAWYREMLTHLRASMPAQMPLSITALASWCSGDRWMAGLPVDEAVPMFFRMEPGGRGHSDPFVTVREPLCAGAIGLSTHEPWPENLQGKRVYLFADGGWHHDDPQKVLKELR